MVIVGVVAFSEASEQNEEWGNPEPCRGVALFLFFGSFLIFFSMCLLSFANFFYFLLQMLFLTQLTFYSGS